MAGMDRLARLPLIAAAACSLCLAAGASGQGSRAEARADQDAAATDPQNAPQVLTGRALTAENQPAAGALVTLLLFDGSAWRTWRTNAAADGAFRIEQVPGKAGTPQDFGLLVEKPGSGPGWAYCADLSRQVEVRLCRPVRVALRIVDADGKPVPGLDVRVTRLVRRDYSVPPTELPALDGGRLSVRTDPDGRGVFEDLPAGAQVLLTQADERYAQFSPASRIVLGDGPTLDAGTFPLAPAATISGVVRLAGPEARPVANVRVHAQPRLTHDAQNGDAITDAQGRFTFRQMANATYDLHCYLGGDLAEGWVSPPRESGVSAGQALAAQDLTLTHGARIVGTITAADTGKGVKGISIGAETQHGAPGESLASMSGADGSYSLRVVPGKQNIYLMMAGLDDYALPAKPQADVEAKDSETLTLDFTLPRVAKTDFVSGRVVDSRGQPVPGAQIFVCTPGEWQGSTAYLSDAQGNFRVHVPLERRHPGGPEWLGAAKVRLFARTETGMVTAQGADASGGAANIVLKLEDHALAEVRGRVNDEAGHPMGGVPVEAHISLGTLSGDGRVVRTDAQGGFAMDELWPGLEYSFHTDTKGYTREGSRQVTLTPGERRQLPDWRLEPARLSIAGQVVDAAGKPVSGASIYAQSQRVDTKPTASDAGGAFRLDGLAEEWLWLFVNFGRPTAASVRVKAGDQQVLVELPAAGAAGRVGGARAEHFERLIGKPAPALHAGAWVNTPPVTEEQWRGKVVLVDFWGVTCAPCIRALPDEQKFWEANQGRGLAMIGLHNAGPVLEVQEFLEEQGLKIGFPLAMDGKDGATGSVYGVVALPTYAVVDRDGTVAYLGHQWEPARQKAADLLDKQP